jgi:dihydropyrimidinase
MLIIKNGDLVGDQITRGDIAVDGNKIIKIASDISASIDDQVVDASGCYVFPGFIDAHTHFAMTNAITTTADDFRSGTKAAVLGGTTTVINFASLPESGSLIDGFNQSLDKARDVSSCNYRFHMEITRFGKNLKTEIKKMKELGVTSYKVYLAYAFRLNDDDIYRTVEAVKSVGGLLGAHCENGDLIDVLVEKYRNKGELSPASHPLCHPAEIEAEAINRLAYIGKMADYPVHVVHLSSQLGLEEIRSARNSGVEITVETCPQYLLLDDSCYHLPGFESAKYIFSPPPRSLTDRQALREAVINGEIQTIATDHCSFNYQGQKTLGMNDFTKVPSGIPGVEQRVPLMYTLFDETEGLGPVELVQRLSKNPAQLYHLYPQKGILAVGSDADIVVYQKNGEYVMTAENQAENVDYTPYEGFRVKGQVKDVLLNGVHVVENGRLVKENHGIYAK